jgi:hypothetical protein
MLQSGHYACVVSRSRAHCRSLVGIASALVLVVAVVGLGSVAAEASRDGAGCTVRASSGATTVLIVDRRGVDRLGTGQDCGDTSHDGRVLSEHVRGSVPIASSRKCVVSKRVAGATVCMVRWSEKILYFELSGFRANSTYHWTFRGFPADAEFAGEVDSDGSTRNSPDYFTGGFWTQKAFKDGIVVRGETRQRRSVTFTFPGHT